MLAVDITKWLSEKGASFDRGVELVRQLDANNSLLSVLKIGDTKFTREKLNAFLVSSLEPIRESIVVENQAATLELEKAKYTPELYFTLPDNLQALEREKSKLFKEIIEARNLIKRTIGLKKPQSIALADVLKLMNAYDHLGNPIPFSISYLSADLESNTGGVWKHHSIAFSSFQNRSGTRNYTGSSAVKKQSKKANHWLNATRNIYVQQGNQLQCIHIWLIFEFNGKEVIVGQPG